MSHCESKAADPDTLVPRILRLQPGSEPMHLTDGSILAGRRFVPLTTGAAVEIGKTLVLEYTHDGPWVLPSLVRQAPSGALVLCQQRSEETWSLPESSLGYAVQRRFSEMDATQIPIGH